MICWSAHTFYQHLEWIARKRAWAQKAVKEAGRDCQVMGVTHHLVTDDRHEIYKCLGLLGHLCSEMQLRATYECCFQFQIKVGNPDAPCYWSDVESGLQGIQWALESELLFCKMAFIPPDKDKYFERDDLFGDAVSKTLPEVKLEIKAAGNCLAADLPDAAVFYLMRIVEFGLRQLARDLKVKIPKTPLDYAGWKAVVKAIDEKLALKIPKARGAKQTEALKFKHNFLADFRAFEMTRNEIMHGRSRYNDAEAICSFNRVREFMRRLAARIAE